MIIKIGLLIILLLGILAGCNSYNSTIPIDLPETQDESNAEEDLEPVEFGSPAELIEHYVRILSSAEFAGRMPGTPGNDLTVEWLIEKLTHFGVEPYSEDGFKMGFPGFANTFTKSEMVIMFADGTSRRLEQGNDFFISLGEGNFSIVASSESDNYQVFDSNDEMGSRIQGENEDMIVYFVRYGHFSNAPGNIALDGRFMDKRIQLSDEIFEIVQSGEFYNIKIENTIDYEQKEIFHVVGRIRGSYPSNSIVISAHFDHVGAGGATYFPGASDNASGTAALLYITQQLKSISENQPFDFDIVIAFFNSEEHQHHDNMMPLGSQYFIPIIIEDYDNIWNINIDCVGSSDNETYMTGRCGSSELREAFTSFASIHGINVDNYMTAASDNVNFTAMGIPSFNFTSTDFVTSGIVHTTLDTYDRIYFSQIVRLADMIVEFLMQPNISFFEADELANIQTPDSNIKHLEIDGHLEAIFDAMLSGERVNLFEDYYSHYPDLQQRRLSYYEMVGSDERLTGIRDFSAFRLSILRTSSLFENPSMHYFNMHDSDGYDLSIQQMNREELNMLREGRTFTEIPSLSGYYAVLCDLAMHSYIEEFLYKYEEDIYFVVTPQKWRVFMLSPDYWHPIHWELRPKISDIYEYSDFLQTLQFDEFIAKWETYFR